jgi:hypothetical protein
LWASIITDFAFVVSFIMIVPHSLESSIQFCL